MIPLIKAEVRKLVSVRMTYLNLGFCIFITFIFAFYGAGIKASPAALSDPHTLVGGTRDALNALAFFGSIAALLLVTQEYRFSTIVYTLTAAKSRSRVLLAKTIVVSGFAAFFAFFIGALSPALTYLGITLAGHHLGPQSYPFMSVISHGLFFIWGYMMMAFVISVIIRNQIGALATLFLIPSVIENILTYTVLKSNAIYLPFTALQNTFSPQNFNNGVFTITASTTKSIVIFLCWLLGTLMVSWYLFVKRDAN